MSSFLTLVGKRVEVSYRTGDAHMTITGSLIADSGASIRIEERYIHLGREKTMLMEIPYAALVRVREILFEPEALRTR